MGTIIVRSRREALVGFGAGSQQPSQERNLQEVEWQLPSGERLKLETHLSQLDGRSPYAVPGGPVMPMYRTVEFKKKRLFGWKKLGEGMEYSGGFAVLNALIRTTDTYKAAEEADRADEVLIQKLKYEHARFGEHAYYNLATDGPVEALTEALRACGSVSALMNTIGELERNPDERLLKEKAELQEELEQLRNTVR